MAKLVVEMTADEHALWQSQQRLIRQQQEYNRGIDETSRKSERASRRAKRGAQEQSQALKGVTSQLGNMVTQWLGIGTALAAANKLLDDHVQMQQRAQELAEKAAGRQRAALDPRALLLQQVGPARMPEMMERARYMMRTGAATTEQEALKLNYDILSAGPDFDRAWKSISQMRGVFADPASATLAAAALRTNFGAAEVGTIPEQFGKMLMVNQIAPTAAAQLAEMTAKGAPGAKFLGLGDEEFGALVAIMAKAYGREGGTRAKALMTGLQKRIVEGEAAAARGEPIKGFRDLRGQGLVPMLEALGGMTAAEQQLFIGTSEEAFGALATATVPENLQIIRDAIAAQTADAGTAPFKLVRDRVRAMSTYGGIAPMRAARGAAGARTVAEERVGMRQLAFEAVRDRAIAWRLDRGDDPADVEYFKEQMADSIKWRRRFGYDDPYAEAVRMATYRSKDVSGTGGFGGYQGVTKRRPDEAATAEERAFHNTLLQQQTEYLRQLAEQRQTMSEPDRDR